MGNKSKQPVKMSSQKKVDTAYEMAERAYNRVAEIEMPNAMLAIKIESLYDMLLDKGIFTEEEFKTYRLKVAREMYNIPDNVPVSFQDDETENNRSDYYLSDDGRENSIDIEQFKLFTDNGEDFKILNNSSAPEITE